MSLRQWKAHWLNDIMPCAGKCSTLTTICHVHDEYIRSKTTTRTRTVTSNKYLCLLIISSFHGNPSSGLFLHLLLLELLLVLADHFAVKLPLGLHDAMGDVLGRRVDFKDCLKFKMKKVTIMQCIIIHDLAISWSARVAKS